MNKSPKGQFELFLLLLLNPIQLNEEMHRSGRGKLHVIFPVRQLLVVGKTLKSALFRDVSFVRHALKVLKSLKMPLISTDSKCHGSIMLL